MVLHPTNQDTGAFARAEEARSDGPLPIPCPHCGSTLASAPASDPPPSATCPPVCEGDPAQADAEVWPRSMAPSASSAVPLLPAVAGAPVLPGYEVLEELGRGGMGVVYKARQLGLNRLVAIKVLRAGTYAEAREVARFRAEAEASARLRHPHIVQIHEIGEQAGLPWFVLEYAEGGTLGQQIAATPQPPRQSALLTETLARAVHYAHEHGIIHRDLKPANVLLTADGQPKVGDFGLAKRLDEAGQTQSGAVVGTPSYMAPEQAAGKGNEVGPPTDVYALGATLYEMLTGRPPFGADTPLDTVLQVLRLDPVPPRRLVPKVPRELETICLKCLRKEPQQRYASAAELADDLRRFLDGQPIAARPVGAAGRLLKWARRQPAVAALAVLVALTSAAGLGGIVWQWYRAEDRAAAAEHARRDEADARQVAERARRDEAAASRRERSQRQEAERAGRAAEETLVDSYTTFGIQAGDAGNPTLAVLWFATAAELARHHPVLEHANRTRVRAWLGQGPLPVGAFPHPGQRIQQLTFHPRGDHLLVMGTRKERPHCTLWNLRTQQSLPLPGDRREVLCAAWSPSGEWLALGTAGDAVELFDFPRGRLVKRVLHPGPITALAFSADSRLLALAGTRARVWDCRQRRFVTPGLNHPAAVRRLAFSPAGGRLATACDDNRARVFAVPGTATGRPLFAPVPQKLKHDGEGWVSGESNFLGENLLVTHSSEREAVLRNATTGAAVHTIPASSHAILKALPSPSGRYLAVCQFFGTQLWDASAGIPVGPVLPQRNYINAAAFSPDGRILLTTCGDRTGRLWSVPHGKPLGPPLYQDELLHAAFSPSGRHVATARDNGLVCVWSVPSPEPGDYHLPVTDPQSFAALSPDGRYLAPTGTHHERRGRLRATRVCELATGQPAGPPLEVPGCLTGAAFAPDGRQLVTLTTWAQHFRASWQTAPSRSAHLAQVWEWRTGRRVRDPIPLPSQPAGAAYSPDGTLLVIACTGGQVLLWDAATGKERRRRDHGGTAALHHFLPNCWVRFSPDGSSFLTCGLGESVRIWDARRGDPLFTCRHRGSCFGADFSADGRLLVSCSEDKTAVVWDATTGRKLHALKHPDWVFNARFHPRRPGLLLTAGRDHMARLWNWHKGEEVCPALRHKDEVFDVHFTPDGDWLLTASRDGTARVWEGETGKPVTPALPLSGWGYQLLVPPDGEHLAVAGLFPGIRVFSLRCLKKPQRPALDGNHLRMLGEVVSGQAVHRRGGASNLTAEQWLERRQRFVAAHPEYMPFDRPAATVLVWHRRQAEACEQERDWFGAAWHLGRLAAVQPSEAPLLVRRVTALAELGRWQEATEVCSKAVAAHPADVGLWHQRALLCLEAKDSKGYRAACEAILQRCGKAEPGSDGTRVVRVWTLAGPPELDARQALPLAERLVASTPRSCVPYHYLGGLLYRAGRFDDAVARLREAAKLHGKDGSPSDWLFLAMAYHRLGKAAEGRKWLDRADRWLAAHLPEEAGRPSRRQSSWLVRLELRLLHREARALFVSPGP